MPTRERVRLLVVDDDPDVCDVLRSLSEHHPVVDWAGAASSPEEAVGMTRDTAPDVILLDHHFPSAAAPKLGGTAGARPSPRGLSGLEAVEFLRAVAPKAVIALYTATSGLKDSAVNAGADLYLVKGPDPWSALDEVAEHVRRRRRRERRKQ